VREGRWRQRRCSLRAKAVDKNGKALAGAAKNSFVKKCEKEAAVAK